jgi:pyruvate,orthophosphate dikinase
MPPPATSALEALQTCDFAEILQAMDGLPVTIRTIDPPLHEFLPNLPDLSGRVAWRAIRPPKRRGVCCPRSAGCMGGS